MWALLPCGALTVEDYGPLARGVHRYRRGPGRVVGRWWGGGWAGAPEFSSRSLFWLPGCLSRPCLLAAAPPRALQGPRRLQVWRIRSPFPPPSAAR